MPLVTLLLVIAIFFASYRGFSDRSLIDRYGLAPAAMQRRSEYLRLLSAGFFHTGWMHLLFNLLVLYSFGSLLEPLIGPLRLLLLFAAGLVSGHLLALYVHRLNPYYTAVGASGAVNALVFASIALFPTMPMGIFLLPLFIPAWAFGLVYVIFSIYASTTRWGNSGHEAHLGGALAGIVITLLFYPQAAVNNALYVALVTLPTLVFVALLLYKPTLLLTGNLSRARGSGRSIDYEFNQRKAREQADIDAILEKIHRKGMKSLTRQEREALEEYSRMRR